jgi:hypothetical protein
VNPFRKYVLIAADFVLLRASAKPNLVACRSFSRSVFFSYALKTHEK